MMIKTELLPIGAVVLYQEPNNDYFDWFRSLLFNCYARIRRKRMIVVQHSASPWDDEVLYMVAEKPILPPDEAKYKVFSPEYQGYRRFVGAFEGNVNRHLLTDTGKRVEVFWLHARYAEGTK